MALSSAEASLYCGEAFVLWGGWGERKRERAGHDGKGEERREAPAVSLFPSSPARFLFLSIIDILIGIPSGSLCGGESSHGTICFTAAYKMKLGMPLGE